jgi:hypothetical protein
MPTQPAPVPNQWKRYWQYNIKYTPKNKTTVAFYAFTPLTWLCKLQHMSSIQRAQIVAPLSG